MIANLEIDAHSSDPAIVLRYDLVNPDTTIRKNKIIQLKNLNEELNCSSLADRVVVQCPLIPKERLSDVEQTIFYLQKRLNGINAVFGSNGDATIAKAELSKLDSYIDLLYEDADKLKASGFILSLCSKTSNLKTLSENEVLMGALSRVFREDSQLNYELATNLAKIFNQLSRFSKFHGVLSKYKIGALSLQILRNELQRRQQWKEQASKVAATEQKKFDLALKKQNVFLTDCLKVLLNLSNDVKVEAKMVKRGVIPLLIKCVDADLYLAKASLAFLWKLSVFNENKQAMGQLGLVDEAVKIVNTNSDCELVNVTFSLLFNLSFDTNMRQKMVELGLVNTVAKHITGSEAAIGLLYQLSIVDDAKAMFTFTDSIAALMEMIGNKPESSLIPKSILVNIALEKRNAQIIVGPEGEGLKKLIKIIDATHDSVLIKVIRNISQHEGIIQSYLTNYICNFFAAAESPKLNQNLSFATDCLAILTQIVVPVEWNRELSIDGIRKWLNTVLCDKQQKVYYPDEYLIHVIGFAGTLATDPELAKLLVDYSYDFLEILKKKQEEDEFCLQIAFLFLRLLTYTEVRNRMCSEKEKLIEYIINMSRDKNTTLRDLCDQSLQIISEVSDYWFKRVSEERFCWHNATWLDMIAHRSAVDEPVDYEDEEDLLEQQFRNTVLDAEEILE
ncbi:unnamed protein product [Bursaphelenchus xylophilus]|uniref:(pine wood nematode) hypothetical protein n=1 Tax=Bursaphelenchus xylophilus TaxID=6326 RepID=A0A1I7S3N6_BURXY|nr:unnamed protein product [Bursaphelenchus xylophilus]CAG9116429.1 unnamed protein product [Bursaphelenchus xylophilus]